MVLGAIGRIFYGYVSLFLINTIFNALTKKPPNSLRSQGAFYSFLPTLYQAGRAATAYRRSVLFRTDSAAVLDEGYIASDNISVICNTSQFDYLNSI